MPATGLNPVKNHEESQERNFAAMERLTATRWAHLRSGLTRVISCCRHFVDKEFLSEMVNEVKDLLAQLKEKYNVLSTALDMDVWDKDNDAPDFDEEINIEIQQYLDMRADHIKRLREAEDQLAMPTPRAGQGDAWDAKEKQLTGASNHSC